MTKYLSVFANKRMLVTLLLGFSGGLPLALIGGTLQAWLTDAKIDVATIGLFALVGLPYTMKFLWAPLMDHKALPFLGLRRGWMVVSQIGLCASTVALGVVGPGAGMPLFSTIAFLVAFFSASQDIVIDAYRTEIISDQKELGAGASTYITGYRIATLVSGGFALGMAQYASWTSVYVLMALLNLVGMVTILFAPEPAIVRKKERGTFRDSVVNPFLDFFQRNGAMEILIFIMVYKLSTLMATALTTKFLMDIGYEKIDIGSVNKVAGLIATIMGTLAGGSLMMKLGLKRSLLIFGAVQSLVGLTFCLLAWITTHGGVDSWWWKQFWLVSIISVDNFMLGLGTAALTGFMMNFANKQFTATQYALLTSVMAVARVILVAHAGTLVEWMGWDLFFISTVPLAIPGLLLLLRFDHWQASAGQVGKGKIPAFDMGVIGLFVFSLICLSSDPLWRLLDMKETGTHMTQVGAFGVVLVVLVGLVKPYLAKKA